LFGSIAPGLFGAGVLSRSHLIATSELARAGHLRLERLSRTLHRSRFWGEMTTGVVGAAVTCVLVENSAVAQDTRSDRCRALADSAWTLLVEACDRSMEPSCPSRRLVHLRIL